MEWNDMGGVVYLTGLLECHAPYNIIGNLSIMCHVLKLENSSQIITVSSRSISPYPMQAVTKIETTIIPKVMNYWRVSACSYDS